MCGIAGIIDSNSSLTSEISINNFARFNKFRGPDAYGIEVGDLNDSQSYALAHHRLSIVDLTESANQPMTKSSWKIIFNGEIYNFREIKAELKKNGSNFLTNSDTEVILELFDIYPIKKALEKLNGMFAIAAINTSSNQVFLARDRWGKKPLYYHHDGEHLSFSSDLRSFSTLNKKFTINKKGLKYYFSELSLPQPETIFNEVLQITPGHFAVLKNAQLIQTEYCDLFKKGNPESIVHQKKANPAENVKELLSAAIETRLHADVPVGAFLSGGIDSGLIVGLSTQFADNINTYTVGFDNSEFDERPFAEIMAKKYKTNHHELSLKSNDINLKELVMEFGEPFADSSMIPSYLISKTVSEHQKVVLSGDGGDELFCGNATYHQAYKFDAIRQKTKAISRFENLLSSIKIEKLNPLVKIQKKPLLFSGRELYRNMGFNQVELNTLILEDDGFEIQQKFEEVILKSGSNPNNIFESIYNGSIRTRLLNDYLVKIDRSSMFASLEIRSPFLDDCLFNYLKNLDKKQLMPKKVLKGILKNLAFEILPNEILNKPKSGFAIPLDSWFRDKWKEIFVHYVFDQQQNLVDLNYKYIKSVWIEHLNGKNHGHKLYAILVFHIWAHEFIKDL